VALVERHIVGDGQEPPHTGGDTVESSWQPGPMVVVVVDDVVVVVVVVGVTTSFSTGAQRSCGVVTAASAVPNWSVRLTVMFFGNLPVFAQPGSVSAHSLVASL
jgi:hypothetical protein